MKTDECEVLRDEEERLKCQVKKIMNILRGLKI
jgi:hypothetical protein